MSCPTVEMYVFRLDKFVLIVVEMDWYQYGSHTVLFSIVAGVENELLVVNKRSITRYSWCKRRLF